MEAGLPCVSEEVSCIRVRSERELKCLRVWSEQPGECVERKVEELELITPKREPRELPQPADESARPEELERVTPRRDERALPECAGESAGPQELELVTPKREPRELPEPASESARPEEFEFFAVKQEPLEQPEDNEFLPQVPECVLEQKDDNVQTGELRPTQEPECIIVQKEDVQPEEVEGGPTQHVHENGVRQKPADIPGSGAAGEEGEEILGLVPEVEWVAPPVPASDEPVTDPLASEGDTVTGSIDEAFYTTGWSHTSDENRQVSPGEADYYRAAPGTASSGGPSSDTFAARSDGSESVQRVFRCDSCSAIFSAKYHLVIHVFTHITEVPPPSHVCRWCAEVFCDTPSLIEHSKGHENGPQVPSVLPKRRSKGFGGGKRRHRVREPPDTKPHICDLCGKAFPVLGNLNLHKRTHSGERPYTCDVCGKSFIQSVYLRKHRLMHMAEKHHYCEFCGRAFSLLDTLKVHVRMHTGENPYSCEVCGAGFTLLGKLKTHQQIHTGRKPFECDECGNFFSAPNSLRRHKRMHSGEKPYSCDLCGESFMWSATLQRHKQVHTGEKPYKCDLCSSAFAEMGGLNRHMRIHTGERPFPCDICGASFTSSNHMRRHRRRQHVENRVVLDV